MIKNRQVYGGPELEIPKDLTFSKYVIDKLRENCSESDEIALINAKTQEQTTHRQLLAQIIRIGNGLKLMGIGLGDMVAICSENCTELIAATVAASSVGATVTLINVKYTKDELLHVLNISEPRLILCSKRALEKKLSTLRQFSSIKYIVQLSGEVGAQAVRSLAAVEVANSDREGYEPRSAWTGNNTAFLFYSSGTTGLPKGVMLTHRNILYGTSTYYHGNKNKATVLSIAPWYHVYGLLTTVQYLVSGNSVVYLTELIPEQFFATIEKYKIVEMPIVPSVVHLLAKSPLVGKYDLSSLNYVLCAAAPLSGDIITRAQKNLPNCKRIFQAYGMTEATATIMKEQDDNDSKKSGSCGIPFPGIIIKVVDVVTREKLGPNEPGEVCIKGPTLMKGYMNNEEASRDMFDDEGFIKSGDIGYYDDDGCFYIIDRMKEIIKYKGQQVSPAAVENVILQHEGVAQCGVVGSPDEVAGELPTAFVVRAPGATLSEQDLLDYTTSRLSPMSRLRGGIIFVEEIPKNGSGKILRRELRKILMERNRIN